MFAFKVLLCILVLFFVTHNLNRRSVIPVSLSNQLIGRDHIYYWGLDADLTQNGFHCYLPNANASRSQTTM